MTTVEHRCYQCGAAVEDGVAFCAHCNAPQIRVMTVDTLLPSETVPESLVQQNTYSPLPRRSSGQWAQALPAAFVGLLIATLLSTAASGAFWLGILMAGFLSVYFYRRRNPLVRPTLKLGARLGALSGAFGFAIVAIAASTATAIGHSGEELHRLTLKTLQERMSRSPDPGMQPLLDLYATRQGFIIIMILVSIIVFLLFLAVSSIGGVIGAALLRRKDTI